MSEKEINITVACPAYKSIPKLLDVYSKIITIIGNGILLRNKTLIDTLYQIDEDYSFLRDVIGENEDQIHQELSNAGNFLYEQYGVELGKFEYNSPKIGENITSWKYGEHKFYAYTTNHNPHNFKDGVGGVTNSLQSYAHEMKDSDFEVHEGGFILIVGAPGLAATGKYTGVIEAGSAILFGYYSLSNHEQKKLYHFKSTIPIVEKLLTLDRAIISWNLDIYDVQTGKMGKALGTATSDIVDMVSEKLVTVPTTFETIRTNSKHTRINTFDNREIRSNTVINNVVTPYNVTQTRLSHVPEVLMLYSNVLTFTKN